MKNYQLNEGTIQLPDNWLDQSMNIFTLPNDTGVNLVINRAPVPTGMAPDEYYEQVLYEFRNNLKDYQEINSEVVQLSEQPAHLLEYNWKTPEGRMHQSTILQIRGNLLITFTYTSPKAFTNSQRKELLKVIYSFEA